MRRNLPRWILIAVLGFAFAGPHAAAETLYKLIDRKGNVTYVQERPKDFDGQVIAIEIDPKANTATLPKLPPRPAPKAPTRAYEERLADARARLENARKALEEARENPGEGDIRRLGIVGGGTRPVPTEDYQRRLAALEAEVQEAEQALQRLRRER